MSQSGSRYLQKELKKANNEPVEQILSEVLIMGGLKEIMLDQYGNYFFQILLSSCSVDQRLRILEKIGPEFIQISCHKQGTHSI